VVNIIGRSIPVQPQQSGVGSLFETLAAPFMDRNSGLAKQSVTSLNTAKTAEIQRALDAGQVFADLIRSGNVNSADADAAAFLAGKNSKDVGGFVYNNTLRNNAPLAGDAVARSALMRGDNYSSTPMAHGQEIAAAQERQRMQEATRMRVAESALEPVMTPDGPRYVRRPDAVNQQPLLSTDQVRAGEVQRILPNVDPQRRVDFALGNPPQKTPRTYTVNGQSFVTYDGINNAQTGQPLPQGGAIVNPQGSATDVGMRPNTQAGLENAELQRGRFRSLLRQTRNLAEKDPTLFGLPGQVRRLGQEGFQLASGLAQVFGANSVQEATASAARSAQNAGVSPQLISQLFDPNLPALTAASNLLVFQAAAALAGQEGRGVTDRDIARFQNIAGDPSSLFESQQSYLSRLSTMESIVEGMVQADADTMGRRGVPTPGAPVSAAPPLGGAPQPGAPAPAPAAPAGGAPVRVNTPQEAMALPSGTQFVTPDGRVKVRP
jgi:hypothetical protein